MLDLIIGLTKKSMVGVILTFLLALNSRMTGEKAELVFSEISNRLDCLIERRSSCAMESFLSSSQLGSDKAVELQFLGPVGMLLVVL